MARKPLIAAAALLSLAAWAVLGTDAWSRFEERAGHGHGDADAGGPRIHRLTGPGAHPPPAAPYAHAPSAAGSPHAADSHAGHAMSASAAGAAAQPGPGTPAAQPVGAAAGYHGGHWPKPAELGGDFSLVDHTGRAVTLDSFKGKPTVLFFGFATCEDICPYSMKLLGAALDALPDKGASVNAVFVSFDDRRDTPESLARFVAQAHPRLVGLTGSRAAVHDVAARFKVHREMLPHSRSSKSGVPQWGHTSHFYLLSAEGKVEGYAYPSASAEDLAHELVKLGACRPGASAAAGG